MNAKSIEGDLNTYKVTLYDYKTVVGPVDSSLIFEGKDMKARLRKVNWDYSRTASYFITVRIARNSPFLGRVVGNTVELNPLGEIVCEKWESIPMSYPNVKLGCFIIMPDHFHGIIFFESTNNEDRTTTNTFAPQRHNLASVMRTFKGTATFGINKIDRSFKWQPRYYDRIIRDVNALPVIEAYIKNNPKKWSERKRMGL